MSTINLPIAVLRSPGIAEGLPTNRAPETSLAALKTQAKVQQALTCNVQQTVSEMHQNRMKNLRKELDYLKDSEWRYESIEKYIGQSF